MQLSSFTRSALGTLVWSESDEDGIPLLDDAPGTRYASGHDVPCEDFDFDEDGLAEFAHDCESFYTEVIESGLSHLGDTEFFAGNFVLTRNGHGAGFWDCGLGADGDKLTKMSRPYGAVGLYRGDDGKLYFHN